MLTKSDLASFRQCPRRLWLEKHAPDKADAGNAATWRRARDGAIVGQKARELLGPDVIWPKAEGSIEETVLSAATLLAANATRPGVEITLVRENLSARADALIPAQGGYVLQETKASTFRLNPETHHLDDIAIQLWVMAASALPLARAELNLLDNQWRYPGGGDYRGLFRPLMIGDEIRERVAQVPQWLAAAGQVLAGDMPELSTGKQCEKPHPCPFLSHCSALDPPGPEHPLELLPGIGGKNLARRLRTDMGYTSLLEPAPEELTGNDAALYQRMQRAHRSGEAVLEAAPRVFNELPWPRYYLDFEGIDLPVPRWAGVRPYEQMPFQWSCHIEHESGAFEHREFLDVSGEDPSLPCIAALLQAIAPDGVGPIFVYFKTYEESRLRELGERHPEHAESMQRLIERLVDLLPLVRESYYHPDMRGSFSIKKVLPTIAPELDYAQMGGVADGTAAQVAYLYAALDAGTTAEKKEEYRRELLRYCERDTWAMTEVAWCLLRKGRPAVPSDER